MNKKIKRFPRSVLLEVGVFNGRINWYGGDSKNGKDGRIVQRGEDLGKWDMGDGWVLKRKNEL